MKDKRISKQELQKIYGVDRTTIEVWRLKYGLPVIEISSHSRYCRESDLKRWEDSMIKNKKLSEVIGVDSH